MTFLHWWQRGNKQRIWPDPLEARDWGWAGRDGRGSHGALQEEDSRVWGGLKEACRTGQSKGKTVLDPLQTCTCRYRMCIKWTLYPRKGFFIFVYTGNSR